MLTSTDSTERPDYIQIPFRDACGMVGPFFVKQFPAKLAMFQVLQFVLPRNPANASNPMLVEFRWFVTISEQLSP
jgi:hypothetical protein